MNNTSPTVSTLWLPIIALVNTAAVLWFSWQTFNNDVDLSFAHEYSVWIAAILSALIVFLAASHLKLRRLFRSQKELHDENAERIRTESLRESEERYRIVTESASDVILTIDQDHTIGFVNAAAEKTFGYRVDELLGNKLFMLMPEHLRAAHAAGLKRYSETENRSISWQGVEFPALHKDGREIPVEITFGEIKSRGERLFTAVIRDITERRKAAEVMQTSEAHYRKLFDSNPNPVLVFDVKSLEILAVNQEAVHQYGYSHEEFLAMSIKDIRPPEGIPMMLDQVAVCAAGQDKLIHGTRHRKKDGTIFDVDIAAHPIPFAGRNARLVLITDITESKRAKEELQQSLSLLTSTFEATAEGILVVDRDNKIVTYNQNFVEMAGVPDDVIKSRDNTTVINYVLDKLADPETFIEKTKQFVLRPEKRDSDIIEFKDGRIFERSSQPQIMDGEVVGRVVSFRDITESKRSEIESKVISEIIQGVATTANLEELLALVQQSIGQAVYAENFYVALHDKQTELLEVPFCMDKFDAVAPPQKLGRGLTAYALRRGLPTLLNGDDVNRLCEQGEIELVGTPSAIWLGIPLRTPTGIIGVLVVQHYEDENAYTTRDMELLSSAADQIALAIQRKSSEDVIRQSEEKYRTILGAIEEVYYEMDLAGNFTYFNDVLVGYLGYGKDELIGLNYRRYVDKETADRLFRAFNKVFTTGAPLHVIEYEVIRKDGTRFFNESSASLIRNTENEPIGFRGVVRDVTERKQAEEVLRQSEEKYRNILETIEEGYFETDLEGAFTFYNDALGDVLGYSPAELLGMPYQHYVDHRNAKKLFISYVKVYRTGRAIRELNWEVISKDGTRRLLESSIILIRDAAGLAVGFRGLVRDVTVRRRTEEALRESESLLAAAQRITRLGSWELDLGDLENLSNNEVRWSDETYRIFGFEPGQVEVSNDLFYNAVHPDDRQHLAEVLNLAIAQRKPYDIEHRAILPDGSVRCLLGQAEMVYEKHTKRPLKLVGTVQDITERRQTDAALRDSEFKLRTLFTNMNEGLTQVDNDEVIQFVNDRLCELTGYEREEMLGCTTLDLLFDDEGRRLVNKANKERKKGISGQYEARLRKKSGELLWVLVSGAPIINDRGKLNGTLGMFMDISERKRVEEQLLHDAFHDALTGLANRALFMDHLRLTIERCKSRHSNYYAVLFLDFDRFKVINDSLGHAEGDEMLKQIARRLESLTRTGDLLARLGGDEFVILLNEMLMPDDAIQIAGRIQESFKDPFMLQGGEVFISASIGIALSTDGHRMADEMLRDADIAMYRAKAKGKARYQVFNEAMRESATTRLQLETEIRSAIERHEFEMYYQPIFCLDTETLNGFEALARWRHPVRGIVPPAEFIPAAEESGLILPLGRWILNESCRQMRAWQIQFREADALVVNVNLSCKQFLQADLVEQVSKTLEETGLAARHLKLEITESYLIENSEKAVKIMNRLKALGVELSLDDFGTGYSSLSYLHRLPISSLKIDRSFISRLGESAENTQIVRTIIEMAQNLKMQVIAEGIETAEQLARLKGLNCGYGQGYFFSRPLESEIAAEFITEHLAGYRRGAATRVQLNI